MVSFHTVGELVRLAEEKDVPIHEIVIAHEMHDTQRTRPALLDEMKKNWEVMQAAIERGAPRRGRGFDDALWLYVVFAAACGAGCRARAAPCGGYTGAALRRGAHPYGGGPARDHGSGVVRACHRLRDHAAAAHHGALCQSTRGVAAPQGGAGVRERRPGTSMCKGVGKCGSFSQRIMRI